MYKNLVSIVFLMPIACMGTGRLNDKAVISDAGTTSDRSTSDILKQALGNLHEIDIGQQQARLRILNESLVSAWRQLRVAVSNVRAEYPETWETCIGNALTVEGGDRQEINAVLDIGRCSSTSSSIPSQRRTGSMQDYPFAAPTIDGGAETNISPEYRTDGEDDTALMGTGGLNDEAANRH